MGKKKDDKHFSYNNTHGHGIYPPIAGQRYPHTDFHQNEPFWIYEQIGILKDWLISLTKLSGMIAQTETNDTGDIVTEINDLIDKLNGWISSLDKYLHNFYLSQVGFDGSLIEALKLPSDIINYIGDYVSTLTPIFKELFECIENRLSIDDTNISSITGDFTNIQNEINNIYNYLDGEYSDKSVTLTYGTDYEIVFYNGFRFYNETMSGYVTISTTNLLDNSFYKLNTSNGSVSDGTAITNDYIYTNNSESDNKAPLFRHANSWRELTQSWIYQIIFKGNYSFLNSMRDGIEETGSNENIWNMRPLSARPTWIVNITHNMVDATEYGGSEGWLLTMRNISDGINDQYYSYINYGFADTVYFGNNLNISEFLTV